MRIAFQLIRSMLFFCSRIVPWAFIIVGGLVLCLGLFLMYRAKESVDWPSAPGQILSSFTERREPTNRSTSESGTGNSPTYRAKVSYEFTVNGVKYQGRRVAYGDPGRGDPSHARAIVRRYPEGKRVAVYYQPDNPEASVLEPGVKTQTWFVAAFGLLFMSLGIGAALLLPKVFDRMARGFVLPAAADGEALADAHRED